MAKEPYHMAKEAYHITKEAYHMAKEAYRMAKEAYHITKEAYHMAKEAYRMAKEAYHMATEAYHMATEGNQTDLSKGARCGLDKAGAIVVLVCPAPAVRILVLVDDASVHKVCARPRRVVLQPLVHLADMPASYACMNACTHCPAPRRPYRCCPRPHAGMRLPYAVRRAPAGCRAKHRRACQ